MAIVKPNKDKMIDDFIDGAKATKADTTLPKQILELEEQFASKLPKSLVKKIKVYAALEDKDIKTLVREIYEAFFEDKNVPGIDK